MRRLNEGKLREVLTKRALEHISDGTITCAHLIVNQDGKRVFDATFGRNGVNGSPLQPNATYRIASMTKPVTALAVLIEAERGHLDLQAPITDYLHGYENLPIARLTDGELEVTGVSKTPIRVYHLLSHTSGIEMMDIITAYTAKMDEAQ